MLLRNRNIVVLLFAVIIVGFPNLNPLTDDESRVNNSVNIPDETGRSEQSRNGPVSTVFFDGFESGDLSGGPWIPGQGWSVVQELPRTGTNCVRAQAHTTDSTLILNRNLDLTQYRATELSLYQYAVETEAQDLYYVEASPDGGGSWDVIGSWNGADLKTPDYRKYTMDLSSYEESDRFRIRFRFTSSSNAEWVRIDDIKITGRTLEAVDGSLTVSEKEIYRYDGSSNISGEFLDIGGYGTYEYEITIGIRDPELNEMFLIENVTDGNNSLNVTEVSPGRFGFDYNWSPARYIPFSKYFVAVNISRPGRWDAIDYGETEVNITLLSYSPYFADEAVVFEKEPVNVFDHRGLSLELIFYDVDRQQPDYYRASFYLNATGNGSAGNRSGRNNSVRNITVFEDAGNGTGLNVSRREGEKYVARYLWFPPDPKDIESGNYTVDLRLWEAGYGAGDEVSPDMFNITRNVSVVKRYVPEIFSLECSPDILNMTGENETAITAVFRDKDTPSGMDFEVYFKIRDKKNNTIELLERGGMVDPGVEIHKSGVLLWTVIYRYDPPASLLTGPYDLSFGVYDGDSDVNYDGFDNNSDKLNLYDNTNPLIGSVSLSKNRVNIYRNDSALFVIDIQDVNNEMIENFSVNLSLKASGNGAVHTLFDRRINDTNSSIPHLKPVDLNSYVFTYDIDPDPSFEEDSYALYFRIVDGRGGSDSIAYGDKNLTMEFFYDAIPTPPDGIWPSLTADTTPLVSWWGSIDEETPYERLEYSLQIGTASGDDAIFKWKDVGAETQYQMVRELGEGEYYIQVRAFDGEFHSEVSEEKMIIDVRGNSPPTRPGPVEQRYTIEQDPMIRWGESTDPDTGDEIRYLIRIGTNWHGSEVLEWTETRTHNFYKVPFLLPYDTYYVQIKATDGYEYSPVREELLYIFDKSKNIAPIAPDSLSLLPEPRFPTAPLETYDKSPVLKWEGAVDLNEDELHYWVRIGTGRGKGDVMGWRSSGLDNSYSLARELEIGSYHVQIKCFDGSAFSGIFEEKMEIIPPPTIDPPEFVGPTFTTDRTPLLNWTRARYSEDEHSDIDLSYEIRLLSGSSGGSDPLLDWTPVSNTTYQVTEPLPANTTVNVDIRAFDGIVYSNMTVPSPTFRVADFRLSVGFNVTNYVFTVEKGTTQYIEGYVMNHGWDDLEVAAEVGGTFAKYVTLRNATFILKARSLSDLRLKIEVPKSQRVVLKDSYISLKLTSPNGTSETSDRIRFNTAVSEEEDWFSAVSERGYMILSILILAVTLIVILLLIRSAFKRSRKDEFDLEGIMKDPKQGRIDDLVGPDLYTSYAFTQRKSIDDMSSALSELLKTQDMVRHKVRVKRVKRNIRSLPGGGREVRALPPPPPFAGVGEVPYGSADPGKGGTLPPPEGGPLGPAGPGDTPRSISDSRREGPFLPEARSTAEDAWGEEEDVGAAPSSPKVEYIPPEEMGKAPERPEQEEAEKPWRSAEVIDVETGSVGAGEEGLDRSFSTDTGSGEFRQRAAAFSSGAGEARETPEGPPGPDEDLSTRDREPAFGDAEDTAPGFTPGEPDTGTDGEARKSDADVVTPAFTPGESGAEGTGSFFREDRSAETMPGVPEDTGDGEDRGIPPGDAEERIEEAVIVAEDEGEGVTGIGDIPGFGPKETREEPGAGAFGEEMSWDSDESDSRDQRPDRAEGTRFYPEPETESGTDEAGRVRSRTGDEKAPWEKGKEKKEKEEEDEEEDEGSDTVDMIMELLDSD